MPFKILLGPNIRRENVSVPQKQHFGKKRKQCETKREAGNYLGNHTLNCFSSVLRDFVGCVWKTANVPLNKTLEKKKEMQFIVQSYVLELFV